VTCVQSMPTRLLLFFFIILCSKFVKLQHGCFQIQTFFLGPKGIDLEICGQDVRTYLTGKNCCKQGLFTLISSKRLLHRSKS